MSNTIELATFYKIVKEYSTLLEQMGELHCQAANIDALGSEIVGDMTLPEREKETLLQFLSHLFRINEELQTHFWMSEHLKIIHELGQAFTKTFKREEIYQKAYKLVSRVMDTNSFFIALYEEDNGKVHFPFVIEDEVVFEPFSINYGEGIVSHVIRTRESMHLKTMKELDDISTLKFGNNEEGQDSNTAIFVPLLIGDHVKGVISAQSYEKFAYKKEHEELLKIIGSQVINAIDNSFLYDTVYEMSIRDELTNLMNRRAFHRDMEAMISKATEEDSRITLMMIDSDDLKKVNDLYGHHVGDIYLKHIANALQKHLQVGDSAYRYAGDEFMILISNHTEDESWHRAIQIQNYLMENPINLLGNCIPISISIGIACFPDHALTVDELKRVTDEALYKTKNSGKNQITIYKKCHSNDCPLE